MDEGTLHALLDGALRAESPDRAAEVETHLAACGDCRARLEAAEELRGEASGILAAATAEDLAAAPDFSEVVRRAGAGAGSASRPGRLRRQARWTRGFAWAASLVLALGTGYLIRDLAGPTVDDAPSRAIGSEALETAPAAGSGPDVSASDDRESAVGPSPAAPAEPTTDPTTEAPAATGSDRAVAPAPERREQGDAGDAGGDAAVDAAAKATEAVGRDAAAEPAGRRGRPAAPERENAVEELVEISPTSFQQAPARWSAITVEEARELLDGPLYVLPRAELLDLYTLTAAPRRRVLSLQRLQTGVPVQVLQWRGEDEDPDVAADRMEAAPMAGLPTPTANGFDPALPHAALPDANVVRVVRDQFVLELTGSLPAALLAVLGETADPAR